MILCMQTLKIQNNAIYMVDVNNIIIKTRMENTHEHLRIAMTSAGLREEIGGRECHDSFNITCKA